MLIERRIFATCKGLVDDSDKRFNPPVGRFPDIEEDDAPFRLLGNEYPPAKQ